jgi:hypothetical protein
MPVTNTSQARIELSMKQAGAIVELLVQFDEEDRTLAGLAIEETNLASTVAVMTAEAKNRIFLIAWDGDTHEIGPSGIGNPR